MFEHHGELVLALDVASLRGQLGKPRSSQNCIPNDILSQQYEKTKLYLTTYHLIPTTCHVLPTNYHLLNIN